MQNYDKSYSDLNKEQKQAVENIDGPLLVVAGPGTGKTQLLSMRVAHILQTTDTDPSQILCLTFTNKAAANMRERLYELAGAETRHVVVKTFHSFAAEIMQRYPEYFWKGAGLSTAPDAVQLEIIEEIVSALPLDNPLAMKFAGQHTMVSDVKNALRLVKEAGLTPAKLRAIIDYNLAYIEEIEPILVEALTPRLSPNHLERLFGAVESLPHHEVEETLAPLKSLREVLVASLEHATTLDEPTGKTKNTGAWKKRVVQAVDGVRGMHDERKRNVWWRLLADVYDAYRDKLHSRGYYDYADMLVEVIRQLEQHADLRADVQEQFLYVHIDEFQDTNTAQLRLAHLVADHYLSEGTPNIMAVGDDDQSIYKFNGAELNNMLGFTTSYPSAQLVVLEKNYRSNQQVLQASERVIRLAKERLVHRVPALSKNLVASSKPAVNKGIQELAIYPTMEHELSAVADKLKQLTSEQLGNTAVLARGHESLGRLAYLCQLRGVPVRYEKSSNIMEHEAVLQFTLLAEIVVQLQVGNKNGVASGLQQSLRHPMWQLTPTQLWQLATSTYPNSDWIATMSASGDKDISIIANWLLAVADLAANQPLPLVTEYLLGMRDMRGYASPIKNYFTAAGGGSVYLETMSALRLLRSMVHEFSKGQTRSLSDYAELVRVLKSNKQIISDDSPYVSGESAVQLLTVHKAKGLEFDSVFVIDCVESNWRPRPARRRPPANLPLQPNGDDDDDYVRLMYVACTRAKHSLHLSSYAQTGAGNDEVTSPLALAAAGDNIQHIKPVDDQTAVIALLEEHIAWPRLETADESAMLKEQLSNFNLNVTGLLNFLDVSQGGPQYFLERNLLRLPEAKTPSLAFGTAVHAALETALQLNNTSRYTLEKVLASFETALKNEYLPEADYKRQLLHGQTLLTHLLVEQTYKLPAGSKSEERFSDVIVDGAHIGGSLDRVDTIGKNELVIVDYKTGNSLPSLVTENKSQSVKAWKHRSQLIFYALLVQNSARFKQFKQITGQMVYLEADNPKNLVKTYTPTTDDINQMARLSALVWRKIKALDLPDTSKYPPDMTGINAFISDLLSEKI